MRHETRKTALLLSILMVTAFAVFGTQQGRTEPRYRAVKIKTERTVTPRRLNDHRQVIVPQQSSEIPPAIWEADTLRFLSGFNLPTESYFVTGLNDSGFVTGYSTSFDPYLWNGTLNLLDQIPENIVEPSQFPPQGLAFGMNNRNDIAGQVTADSGLQRAAVWFGGTGKPIVLGTLQKYFDSWAFGINNNGEAIGLASRPRAEGDASTRGFTWSGGGLNELQPLSVAQESISDPLDINDDGWVVGKSTRTEAPVSQPRATLWRNGTPTDIDQNPLEPTRASVASAINDSGMIVYTSTAVNGTPITAYLWDDGTSWQLDSLIVNDTFDDGTPVPPVRSAVDINNKGDILTGESILLLNLTTTTGLIVNSTGDAEDMDPNDGRCYTGNLNSVGDDECTLRAAIQQANAQAGRDTIKFDIPAPGIPTINPATALPDVTEDVFIDATTQPGGKVEVSGSLVVDTTLSLAAVDGLTIKAGSCQIEGLIINRFSGNGLVLSGDSCTVYKTIIGTTTDTSSGLGNAGHGILIDGSSDDRIGDSFFENENIIAYNGGAGVFVNDNAKRNWIQRNVMVGNGGLGIDLAPLGVNPNDSADIDVGANNRVNFPVIDSVTGSTANPIVWGTMSGEAESVHIIELYVNDDCDSSGNGEGKHSVATTVVNLGIGTKETFHTPLTTALGDNQFITATTTDHDRNTSEFSRCWPHKRLRIVDANGDSIANTAFELYRVRNNPPEMTETLLDTVITDVHGEVELRIFDLGVGDSVKISRVLTHVAARKHQNVIGTTNSVTLDNAIFDSLFFNIKYDELDTSEVQTITMTHTTIAYNLLVSIEWDVDLVYLDSLKSAFRQLANYMYDVSDGQIRFDTIAVYDEKQHWAEADIQVLADNTFRSEAAPGGLFKDTSATPSFMRVPRRWFGSGELGRKKSVTEVPLNPAALTNVRMMAHEFGHLGLRFFDEYLFLKSPWRCSSLRTWFGFMEYYYQKSSQSQAKQQSATEMSSARQYQDPSCRTTKQYVLLNASCWDFFEKSEERKYDGVLANIIKPDERWISPSADFFEGPNDGGIPANYDVGKLVHVETSIGAPAAKTQVMVARDFKQFKPLAGARVRQTIAATGRHVIQGQTANDGKIKLLGASPGDFYGVSHGGFLNPSKTLRLVSSSQASSEEWYSGTIEATGIEDTIVAALEPISGYFPFVCSADLGSQSLTLDLTGPTSLPDTPTGDLWTAGNANASYTWNPAGAGYDLAITDDLAGSGILTVNAVDDSSKAFFFDIDYSVTELSDTTDLHRASSSGADAEFSWEATAGASARAIVVSADYPTVRNGVDPAALQVGRTHALALDNAAIPGDDFWLTLSYTEPDLDIGGGALADENSIRIFKWNPGSSQWEMVGGMVDTMRNEVTINVPLPGVYTAFTTDIDVVPPVITIGVLQNPILPDYVDVYVLANEPLATVPVLTANQQTVTVTANAGEAVPTFSASYQLSGSGSVTLHASANDLALNQGEATEVFESYPVGPSAGKVTSADNQLTLQFPDDALPDSRRLLLFTKVVDGRMTYDLRPHELAFDRPVVLSIAGSDGSKMQQTIARQGRNGEWEAIPTTWDENSGRLTAPINRLGVYQVRTANGASPIPRRPELGQNYPNPFNSGTVIPYVLSTESHVRIDLYNLLGHRIATVVNEVQSAGRHTVIWDGRNASGRAVASGLYFYRLSVGDVTVAKKMILLK